MDHPHMEASSTESGSLRPAYIRKMESDNLQVPQEETLTCSICQGIFMNPLDLRCGHMFCKDCLFLFPEPCKWPAYCPMCRQPTQQKFNNNISTKKQVSIVRKKRLMEYLNSEEHKCVTHKERKTIFCDKNRILLCQWCSDSQEHRGHIHCSINVAVDVQMKALQKQMESLYTRLRLQQIYVERERNSASLFSKYVNQREETIREVYRKQCPTLKEEEDQHIECMRHQSKTILEELRKSEDMLIHIRSQLIEVYRELMTISQKPYEVLLVQDLDDLFRRSKLATKLDSPQGMIPRLSTQPNPGLTASFNSFLVKIPFEHLIRFNYFFIRLLHENTSLDSGATYRTSWGKKSFSTGKYYWEVDLKDYERWDVGVCHNACFREGTYDSRSGSTFLLRCCGGQCCYYPNTQGIENCIERPVGRVGVFLDCEGEYVSFLDVAKSSLIHSYSPGTVRGAFRPFFSAVYT